MRPMDAIAYVHEARDAYAKGGPWERVWPIIGSAILRSGVKTLGPRETPSLALEEHVTGSEFAADERELGQVIAAVGRPALEMGEVFIVRQNMCQLIEGVWEAMPEQMLLPSDLPSHSGIIFFEQPIILDPGRQPIWGVLYSSASTSTFKKALRQYAEADVSIAMERSRGCWLLPFHDKRAAETAKRILDEANPQARSAAAVQRLLANVPHMMLADIRMFEYGKPPNSYRSTIFGGHAWQRDKLMGRIAAFFALCRQELPAIERFEPTGKELRQLRRMDMRGIGVSVIMLRRQSGRGNHDTEVEWSHRWLVRGHWRNQYYASEGVHRLIYINPHIKGPEDKPFKMTEKINILGR